jgi:phage-related protein
VPTLKVVLYRDDDGSVPLLEWFASLSAKAKAKCLVRVERLKDLGHELKRPEADYLGEDIYELRASLQGIHYRMLYFFPGRNAVVLSHGLTKEREVPRREIERALVHRVKYLASPQKHTFEE